MSTIEKNKRIGYESHLKGSEIEEEKAGEMCERTSRFIYCWVEAEECAIVA